MCTRDIQPLLLTQNAITEIFQRVIVFCALKCGNAINIAISVEAPDDFDDDIMSDEAFDSTKPLNVNRHNEEAKTLRSENQKLTLDIVYQELKSNGGPNVCIVRSDNVM